MTDEELSRFSIEELAAAIHAKHRLWRDGPFIKIFTAVNDLAMVVAVVPWSPDVYRELEKAGQP